LFFICFRFVRLCSSSSSQYGSFFAFTNFVLFTGAWARSGVAEGPHNAERLLKRMLDHDYVKPDSLSYNGVVDAWAYSGKPEAVQKVKQIWQHMEQLYAQDEEKRIKPTIRTVNSIIQAHAKQVQALIEARNIEEARKMAREAEEFLDLMKERYEQTQDPDHMPDVMTYTTVMDTYGRCGRYHSTLRAKTLFEELQHLYKETGNPRLKPNVRTYTSLITAWSKTRSPDSTKEAERLLKQMWDSKDPEIQPNARTYTSVIHAWGRSNDHDKAQRALKVLQDMKALQKEHKRLDLKPTLVTYNAALDACARCQGDLTQQTDALKISFAILKAIQQDDALEANSMTFSTLLRACSFLLASGPERNKVGTVLFEKATKAGMADYRVLLQLRKAVDSVTLQELLKPLHQDGRGNFDFNTAPPSWSRNVR
jgi:Pentatricopeptide repeat domain